MRQATNLLIDQVRAISNRRLGSTDAESLARAEQALRWLTGA